MPGKQNLKIPKKGVFEIDFLGEFVVFLQLTFGRAMFQMKEKPEQKQSVFMKF